MHDRSTPALEERGTAHRSTRGHQGSERARPPRVCLGLLGLHAYRAVKGGRRLLRPTVGLQRRAEAAAREHARPKEHREQAKHTPGPSAPSGGEGGGRQAKQDAAPRPGDGAGSTGGTPAPTTSKELLEQRGDGDGIAQ